MSKDGVTLSDLRRWWWVGLCSTDVTCPRFWLGEGWGVGGGPSWEIFNVNLAHVKCQRKYVTYPQIYRVKVPLHCAFAWCLEWFC